MPAALAAGNLGNSGSIGGSGSGSIGIFDSGVGGLSVLRHVRAALPAEILVYCADAAFAPYGDRPESLIVERALAIAAYLVGDGAKALVVACNTATAAAIAAIRDAHPQLVVVGVEPGLKPAAALSASRVVGVLATTGTLASSRFAALQLQIEAATGVRFILQACPGLADQVEKGELQSAATRQLIDRLVQPLLAQGADTLVLGCTHYPFVAPLIAAACANGSVDGASGASGARSAGTAGDAAGSARTSFFAAIDRATSDVRIIDTGEAVARRLVERLRERGLLRRDDAGTLPDAAGNQQQSAPPGALAAVSTGSTRKLAVAFRRLLGIDVAVAAIAVERMSTQP